MYSCLYDDGSGWTAEEDRAIREGVVKHGHNWGDIAEHVGRGDEEVRGRWEKDLDPGLIKVRPSVLVYTIERYGYRVKSLCAKLCSKLCSGASHASASQSS